MTKFTAIAQIVAAVILLVIVAATAINLVLIAMRPETVSVVNTMIGQIFIMACLAALAKILLGRGILALKSGDPADQE